MKKQEIKRVYSLSNILISGGLLVLGLFFTFIVPSLEWLGILLLITVAFMLPIYRTGYKIDSEEGIYLKKDILLPRECKRQIADYIEGRSKTLDIDPFKKGGMILEWYFKNDHSKQFGQIYDYENNIYTPQCKLSELNDEQIETLLKYQS